ncbi:cysteinyl leukotriene receptor 2 [Austrofundulus limnaeus]|uniref:Cysteinyl leukotriene receptor 2 n=1 Tax=Austrofundulus limnaeus TaxID=52670 RepID=A0A2I4AHY8_AUSLI|nr:PREDICTED: cysteinyl leukotriene receptor 2-like [Austrofundulus limnaeus]
MVSTISTNITNSSVPVRALSHCYHDDSTFKYLAYTCTYILVFPVAFLCNTGALVVFFQIRKRISAPHVVMVNLALSDWAFSLTLPLRLVYYVRDGIWDFPDWLCRVCVFGFYVNLYSSILLFTLLSVLRWKAVTAPLDHNPKTITRRTAAACLIIWLFVGATSVPFLFQGVLERQGVRRCFEPGSVESWSKIYIMNYLGVGVGFLVPFLIIIFCYSKVIQNLRNTKQVSGDILRNKVRRHNRRHSVYLVTMVIVTFLLCFLPYHLIRTLHLHAVIGRWSCEVTRLLQRAVSVTLCLAASNSMINPLLYYYATRTFRKDLSQVQTSFRTYIPESFRRGSVTSNRQDSLRHKYSQAHLKN